MGELIVDLPDDLLVALRSHPLPLPVDTYCRRALEDAVAREEERRRSSQDLADTLEQLGHRLERHADPEELLSVPEAARLLRLSPGTVRKLIRDGTLRSADVGQKKLIPRHAVSSVIHGRSDPSSGH